MVSRGARSGGGRPGRLRRGGAVLLSVTLVVALVLAWPFPVIAESSTQPFPRIMGMNIGDPVRYGETPYQEALARNDVLVLNFWPQWMEWRDGAGAARRVVQRIKQLNPRILVGQYTNVNEAKPADAADKVNVDVGRKIDREGWWLVDASGRRVRWTEAYGAFDVNISDWSKPDDAGLRFPEWYADRSIRIFFEAIPEIDFWYLDNSLSAPAVSTADWDRDGRGDSSTDQRIASAYRAGHMRYWSRIKSRRPGSLLVGNVDAQAPAEYLGRLNGAFLEALMGEAWSTERLYGWAAMMNRYRMAMANVTEPKIVGFGVVGGSSDFKLLRFALGSCLLDNGYFSYSANDGAGTYGGVAWFDEYDVDLGVPIDPPPRRPWRGSVYRRAFTNGLVLVNSGSVSERLRVESGYRRIAGRQDPAINNGSEVDEITLAGRDGLVLLRVTR